MNSPLLKASNTNVAIFWDLESCRPEGTSSIIDTVSRIRERGHSYGSILQMKAYSSAAFDDAGNMRAKLGTCGVSVVDAVDGSGSLTTTLIVDIFTFILTHAGNSGHSTNPTTIIVLCAADLQLAYAISSLRLLRQLDQIVVVTHRHGRNGSIHGTLAEFATKALDWDVDVMGRDMTRDAAEDYVVYRNAHPQQRQTDQRPAATEYISPERSSIRQATATPNGGTWLPNVLRQNPGSDLRQTFASQNPVVDPRNVIRVPNEQRDQRWTLLPAQPAPTVSVQSPNRLQRPPGQEKAPQWYPGSDERAQWEHARSSLKRSQDHVPHVDQRQQHMQAPSVPRFVPPTTSYPPTRSRYQAASQDHEVARIIDRLQVPPGRRQPVYDGDNQSFVDASRTLSEDVPLNEPKPTQAVERQTGSPTPSLPYDTHVHAEENGGTSSGSESRWSHLASPKPSTGSASNVSIPMYIPQRSRSVSDSEEDSLNITADIIPRSRTTIPTISPSPISAFTSPAAVLHSIPTESSSPRIPRDYFDVLVAEILRSRTRRPKRSEIAVALLHNPRHLNRMKFREYAALAQDAGVVVLGGLLGESWIALSEDYLSGALGGYTSVDDVKETFVVYSGHDGREEEGGREEEEEEVEEDAQSLPTLPTDGIPNYFKVLIEILRQYPRGECLRSNLGLALHKLNKYHGVGFTKRLFFAAGARTFGEYVAVAGTAGLVECGGNGGREWIRLIMNMHPDV